jgi:hypothetical protein
MSHRVSLLAFAVASLVLMACATSTPSFNGVPSSGRAAECPPLAPSSYRVTGAELRGAHVLTLLEAVGRVRPRFLRSHSPRKGQSAVVYVDRVRVGPVARLRDVPVMDVVDVVFLGAADATTRFGSDHTGGALLVRTHMGPEGRRCPGG